MGLQHLQPLGLQGLQFSAKVQSKVPDVLSVFLLLLMPTGRESLEPVLHTRIQEHPLLFHSTQLGIKSHHPFAKAKFFLMP